MSEVAQAALQPSPVLTILSHELSFMTTCTAPLGTTAAWFACRAEVSTGFRLQYKGLGSPARRCHPLYRPRIRPAQVEMTRDK